MAENTHSTIELPGVVCGPKSSGRDLVAHKRSLKRSVCTATVYILQDGGNNAKPGRTQIRVEPMHVRV